MSKSYIYEPLPEGAKPVAWWWAIVQVPLLFLLAALGAALVAIGVVSIAMLNGSWDPVQSAEPPAGVVAALIVGGMFGLFIGLMAVSLMKIKIEKRSLASAGLNGFLYGGKFWLAFFGGILFAVVVSLPGSLLGAPTGIEETEFVFNAENLMTGQYVFMMVGLLIFLLIQAPAEEVFARGWLMSALAWRHGLVLAVIFSSAVFMLLHGDRAFLGLGWLVYTFCAVGSIGVMLAAVSYASRSVIPAAGLHTGYNFTLFAAVLTYLTGASENGDIVAAFMEMMDSMGDLGDLEFTPAMVADLAVRTLIPLGIAGFLFSRRKTSPAMPSAEVTTA
ncbi:CPBP family intramembrane glutamic endopeptidase [Aquisalinus flavus]|uniref:CAAX prenyl protease 2/Lysostaphin resistance protein A-like domain-containing protein n=1 Tax=Aquisalinus flavus TaxID=1526572 RepID=A0A8J2Y475_9PROT|nr:CPBP family intramembrane glutamic endopeptidase [Aquisalinus flavus]MBD0425482.1 CPBP family intramembrane metalloprotease [Aquisalinus flavus]UNE48885.1 CPBP family intramembrane metalloprotease [Aquisalinus flavus]GGD15712.1 hypothetical protein GCM10011342_25610 [Aquisalinus flavus]